MIRPNTLRPITLSIVPAALALLFAVLVWTCLQRGPWYDELYTQFVTRPGVPLGKALRESWLADNHPPLYYILARATAWLGDIARHRLMNIGVLALAVAGGFAIVRDVPRLAPAAGALVLGLAASKWTPAMGSELRSYFLSLCAGAVLVLALSAIRISGEAGSPMRRTAYWVAAFLGFNTHIVSSLTCAALVAPFLGAAALRRDWREARAVALAPLVSGLVLCAVTAIQLPIWLANTKVFWIEPGFSWARWTIELSILDALKANPVLLLGALGGGVLLTRDVTILRRPSGEFGAMALLGLGIVIASVGLVALHMLRPMVIEKYLMVLLAAVVMGLAIAFGRLLRSLGPVLRLAALALAFAAMIQALLHNARLAADRESWFGSGRVVADLVKRCPGTVVHVDPNWNDEVLVMLPRDNAHVVRFSYRYVARQLGFALAPWETWTLSSTCPTVFWGEHDNLHHWGEKEVTAHLRARGVPVQGLKFRYEGKGWVAVVPPQPAS